MTSVARAPRPAPRARPSARPDLYVVGDRRSTSGRGARTGQDHLDRVNASIRAEQDGLARDRLALAEAQSPERIAHEATRLGMVPADHPTWINPAADQGRGAPTTAPDTDTPDRRDGPVDPATNEVT